jgi:diguanylate cyclase (GGDEF)-like protein
MNLLQRFDGWWHGLYMACIAFPLFNIGAKVAIEQYNANPLVFLCFASLFSALFLLIYAGRGMLALKSIQTLDTWVFSFLNLAALSFGLSLLVYVSALQGSILIRLASFACFAIALIMGQSTTKKECFFSMVAFSGIAILFFSLPLEPDQKAVAFLLLLGAALCQALRQLLSEFHKTSNQARSTKESARVAGVVSSVSALVLTFVLLFFALYQKFFGIVVFDSFPEVIDFFNLGTIVCAALVGFFNGFAVYSEFYASKKISAKYLSAMLAVFPFFVFFYESIVNMFIGGSGEASWIDLLSLFMLVAGNLGIAISAIIEMKKNGKETELREKYITASEDNVEYAINLVKSTMSFTHNDIARTVELLGVEERVIIDLLAAEDPSEVSISKLQFHTLNKNYYLGVSTKDSLTKINNRGALEQKIEDVLYKKEKFDLCFIDLDRFKAINDMYGHDVGDEVLKHIANIMLKVNPKGINGRNGGDEFVMVIFKDTKQTVDKFKKHLSEVFKYNDISISLIASVGVTSSNGKLGLDELIKLADEQMYQQKKQDK